jgi:hypothetical protein
LRKSERQPHHDLLSDDIFFSFFMEQQFIFFAAWPLQTSTGSYSRAATKLVRDQKAALKTC